MKITSGLVVALAVLQCSVAMGSESDYRPKIEIDYKVILSTGMEAAVKAYDPEFEVWRAKDFEPFLQNVYRYGAEQGRYMRSYQSLSAVIGDFNGDDILDTALLGHNKINDKLIVVLSQKVGYGVVEIFSYPFPAIMGGTPIKDRKLSQCLGFMLPGKIKAASDFDRPEINLKTDAFTYGGENASGFYYYTKGKFVNYALSD